MHVHVSTYHKAVVKLLANTAKHSKGASQPAGPDVVLDKAHHTVHDVVEACNDAPPADHTRLLKTFHCKLNNSYSCLA